MTRGQRGDAHDIGLGLCEHLFGVLKSGDCKLLSGLRHPFGDQIAYAHERADPGICCLPVGRQML